MQPTPSSNVIPPVEQSLAALELVLRHLAHDLRQPLSGIESIAYYLEMVLADAEPEIGQHCQRLRRMVQQANWILNDASLAARMFSEEEVPLDLRLYFSALGARYAVQEECTLELHFAGALPVVQLPAQAPRLFEHLIAFVRDVAQASDPVRVAACLEDCNVRLTITADLQGEGTDLLKILETGSPSSAVRRFFQACGGSMQCMAGDGRLTVAMLLPAVEQA